MENGKYIGFVGCYTKEGQADPFEASHAGVPHDRSKIGTGVLAIGVDAAGKLSLLNDGVPIVKAEEFPNPSYLCILERSESSNRPPALKGGGLCMVSETDKGTFQSFALSCDKTEGGGIKNIQAKAIGEALDTGGSYSCHIIKTEVGSDMECILVCDYGEEEGVLSIFGYDGKGAKNQNDYSRQVCIRFGSGSKVDLDRQLSSHAHSTSLIKPLSSDSLVDLCCADLGSDAIIQYSLNTSTSNDGSVTLQCVEKERLAAPPGSGPRSLTFNPIFQNVAIVSLEMTAEVWLIRRKAEDNGSFDGVGDPVSVLPENWPSESAHERKFNLGRWVSDAVWSPDGKFAYAAARLHNSISVFQVKVSNTEPANIEGLKLVQRVSTGGLTPRCLTMSECGEFLLVAHQHSHDVSSFQRNEDDGTIAFTDKLEMPCAACVKLICPDQIC